MERVAWDIKEKEPGFSWTNYEDRVRRMRMMISPEDHSILDFGAGVMFLKKLLPKDISYYPVDFKKRFDETIVCDFNKKEFPNLKVDVAFCSGVLEYIEDMDWFAERLSSCAKAVILSYCIFEAFPDIEDRRSRGWANDFTLAQLLQCFTQHGFYVSEWDHLYPHRPLLKLKKLAPASLADNYFCTGCGACANICGHGAIVMRQDEYGYYRPALLEEKCVNCGECMQSCPTIFPQYHNVERPDCYAVAMEDELRWSSSSGGLFPALAEWTLENNGEVCGAAWTEDFHVKHHIIRKLEDLPPLCHSKYAQSDMGTVFREIKRDLTSGKRVLFSACPCQVAGLYAYLGQDYPDLFTIDLICAQSPSSEFFRKYLAETQGGKKVADYIFRTKEKGWSTHFHRIVFGDGTEVLQGIDDDIYQQAFHPRLMMPHHCEECRFCGFPRQGDISIGDYHGIDERAPSLNDGKGLSVLLVNSQKGGLLRDILRERAKVFAETPLDWVVQHNRVRREGFDAHVCRDTFYDLIRDHSFRAAAEAGLYWKRDIGIFGCWSERNYGSELTYYALYRVVRSLGYSVLLFERPMDAPWHGSGDLELFRRDPTLPGDVACKYPSKRDMRALNERCEMFLLGSDQLWPFYNSVEFGEVSYLDFIHDNKKKVAFATSFGTDRWFGDELHRAEYSHYLHRFSKISVREHSGAVLCRELFGVEADWVLDPVFMCPKEEYCRLADQSEFGEGAYIGAYILDVTEEKQKALQYVSERFGIGLEIIPDAKNPKKDLWNLPIHDGAFVEDFLKMFRDCQFVVTDSFHGMCFSILFHKPFIAIVNEARGVGRFIEYGRLFGVMDRIVFDADEILAEDNGRLFVQLDYEEIDRTIARERKRSMEWLQNALTCSSGKCSMSGFDIAAKRIDRLEDVLADTKDRLGDVLADTKDRLGDALANTEGKFEDALADTEDRLREGIERLEQQAVKRLTEAVSFEDQMLFFLKQIRKAVAQLLDHQVEFEQTVVAVHKQSLQEIKHLRQQSMEELEIAKKQGREELHDCLRIMEEDLSNRIDQLEDINSANQN